MEPQLKIAIVVSHPIQHFCPQYASFTENENCKLKVFFGSTLGHNKYLDPNFKEEISWSNLNLSSFEHIFLNGAAVLQADKFLDAPSLDQELRLFAPDLVVVYGYFQRLQRRARRWGIKHNVPLAYISDAESRQHRHPFKELFLSIFLRTYFSKIRYFLTVGDANEVFYKKYGVGPEKMLRMHFPIDVKQYKRFYEEREILKETVRGKYGIGKNEIVLCVVGKLVEWKNQDHILKAMKILESRGIGLRVFILGSGERQASLELEAKNLKTSKVYFPGFVSIDDLPAYYAAADVK